MRDASTIKVSSNVVIIVVYLSAPTVSCDGARRQMPDPSVLAVTGIIVVDSLYGVWGGYLVASRLAPWQRLFLFSLTRPLRALPRHHPLKRTALRR